MVAIVGSLQRFLGSWRFPVLGMTVLMATTFLGLAVLFVPPSNDALGAFAEDFKVWCFGYDPATGTMQWAYVVVFLVQPIALGLVTVALWAPTFRGLTFRMAGPWLGAGLAFVALGAAGLGMFVPAAQDTELPFPAEELRTAIPAPALALPAHDGTTVDLAALRGHVVLVTAVYASCGYACPTIMAQSRDAVAALTPEERDGLRVVAITLDAAKDTPEVLAAMAKAQNVEAPLFRLLSGEPARVEAALDAFGFERKRDPETDRIDHANLFLLIDRDGRLAYRFTLGDRQKRWLVGALKLLLAERGGDA